MKKAIAESKARRQASIRELLGQYLTGHPCVDCGVPDIRVLEFDHVRGHKIKDIGKMLAIAAPLDRVKEELAKCDVRCANCHRRKTVTQLGWGHVPQMAERRVRAWTDSNRQPPDSKSGTLSN